MTIQSDHHLVTSNAPDWLLNIALLLDLGDFRVQLLVVFAGTDLNALFLTAAEQVRYRAYGNNRAGAIFNFLGRSGLLAGQGLDISLCGGAVDWFLQAGLYLFFRRRRV